MLPYVIGFITRGNDMGLECHRGSHSRRKSSCLIRFTAVMHSDAQRRSQHSPVDDGVVLEDPHEAPLWVQLSTGMTSILSLHTAPEAPPNTDDILHRHRWMKPLHRLRSELSVPVALGGDGPSSRLRLEPECAESWRWLYGAFPVMLLRTLLPLIALRSGASAVCCRILHQWVMKCASSRLFASDHPLQTLFQQVTLSTPCEAADTDVIDEELGILVGKHCRNTFLALVRFVFRHRTPGCSIVSELMPTQSSFLTAWRDARNMVGLYGLSEALEHVAVALGGISRAPLSAVSQTQSPFQCVSWAASLPAVDSLLRLAVFSVRSAGDGPSAQQPALFAPWETPGSHAVVRVSPQILLDGSVRNALEQVRRALLLADTRAARCLRYLVPRCSLRSLQPPSDGGRWGTTQRCAAVFPDPVDSITESMRRGGSDSREEWNPVEYTNFRVPNTMDEDNAAPALLRGALLRSYGKMAAISLRLAQYVLAEDAPHVCDGEQCPSNAAYGSFVLFYGGAPTAPPPLSAEAFEHNFCGLQLLRWTSRTSSGGRQQTLSASPVPIIQQLSPPSTAPQTVFPSLMLQHGLVSCDGEEFHAVGYDAFRSHSPTRHWRISLSPQITTSNDDRDVEREDRRSPTHRSTVAARCYESDDHCAEVLPPGLFAFALVALHGVHGAILESKSIPVSEPHDAAAQDGGEKQRGSLFLFGGASGQTTFDDAFVCSLAPSGGHWQRVARGEGAAWPAARLYHAAAATDISSPRCCAFVFGGAPDSKTTTPDDPVFSDLWCFTLHEGDDQPAAAAGQQASSSRSCGSWEELPQLGDCPGRRGSTCMTVVDNTSLILFSGFDGRRALQDVREYTIATGVWRVIGMHWDGPPRCGAACCVAPIVTTNAYEATTTTSATGATTGGSAGAVVGAKWWTVGGTAVVDTMSDDEDEEDGEGRKFVAAPVATVWDGPFGATESQLREGPRRNSLAWSVAQWLAVKDSSVSQKAASR